jgi:hypothetical protein
MPRICRPINPMEGRDYLTLDDDLDLKRKFVNVRYRGVPYHSSLALLFSCDFKFAKALFDEGNF